MTFLLQLLRTAKRICLERQLLTANRRIESGSFHLLTANSGLRIAPEIC